MPQRDKGFKRNNDYALLFEVASDWMAPRKSLMRTSLSKAMSLKPNKVSNVATAQYSSLRNRVSIPSVFHELQKAWIRGCVYVSHVLVSVKDRHSRVPSDFNGLASQRT